MDIVVKKINDVFIKVEANPSILAEISDSFTFDVPGAKFSWQVKKRLWDGKKRLFDRRGNKLPGGLALHLRAFAKKNNYTIDFTDVDIENSLSLEETYQFAKSLNIHSKGLKISFRDYQLLAFRKVIQNKRIILVSPTSSGKSAIIYCVIRYLQAQKIPKSKKIILVVPLQSLVEQMYKDFGDYSSNDPNWNVEDNCHRLYQGHAKTTDKQVIITTWHSLNDGDSLTFANTRAIIGDECHSYKSDLLTDLFGKFKNCPYKIGTTGTLQDPAAHRLILEGTFGPAYNVITVKKLTENKQVAKVNIKCLVLHHKKFRFDSYDDELRWLMANEKRNNFIKNLALSLKGNTLILVNHIDDHLLPLVEALKKSKTDQEIFVIHGGVKVEDRETIRAAIEVSAKSITIASFGVFSQGVNVQRIHNIITGSSNQSKIRVLQSLGRGLRLGSDKSELDLYDIADYFDGLNRTFRHYQERIKLYDADGHEYKEYKIRLY